MYYYITHYTHSEMGCSEQVERNLKICNNCQKVHLVKLLCVCVQCYAT